MDVDKARRQHPAAALDDVSSLAGKRGPDRSNTALGQRDVGDKTGGPAAVDDGDLPEQLVPTRDSAWLPLPH
jgi:hypothetical protein